MFNIDRHIAIQAGWIAGPAFGVAMMAAPEYFHLGPIASGLLFWGGIAIFLLTIIVVVVLSLHDEKKRKTVLGPIILMSLSAFGLCIGAAWYFWPKQEAVDAANILDQTVQLTCEWSQLPTIAPQHKLYELELVSGNNSGGAFISFYHQPGSPINMINKDAPSYAYRCRFNNFGATSIINMTAKFELHFRKVERSETGTRSGEAIESYKLTTPPISLAGGRIFDFYVRNYSTLYADMGSDRWK